MNWLLNAIRTWMIVKISRIRRENHACEPSMDFKSGDLGPHHSKAQRTGAMQPLPNSVGSIQKALRARQTACHGEMCRLPKPSCPLLAAICTAFRPISGSSTVIWSS